ncbi:MAG: hypothetical protein PHE88_03810 [Elusimicrobia bacterium]|nr:hypothetical protein [Elusimicrobiota bacterium]
MDRCNWKIVALFFCCLVLAGCAASQITLNPQTNIKEFRKIAVVGPNTTPEVLVAAGLWEADLMALGFTVVDRGNIDTLLKEQGLSLSGVTKSEQSMKIGSLLGVDGILYVDKGISEKFTGKCGQVHLVDANTGKVVFVGYPTDIYDLYTPLRQTLKKMKWEHFMKNPFYTSQSYLIGKEYLDDRNNISVDRFKYTWPEDFDQDSIQKVAISPNIKHDLMAALISIGYDIIERPQLERILKEAGLSATGIISSVDMKKINQISGIDGMVFSEQVRENIPGQGYINYHFIKMVKLDTGSIAWSVRIFDFKQLSTEEEISDLLKTIHKKINKLKKKK